MRIAHLVNTRPRVLLTLRSSASSAMKTSMGLEDFMSRRLTLIAILTFLSPLGAVPDARPERRRPPAGQSAAHRPRVGHVYVSRRRGRTGRRVASSERASRPAVFRRTSALQRQGQRGGQGSHGNAGAIFLRAAGNDGRRQRSVPPGRRDGMVSTSRRHADERDDSVLRRPDFSSSIAWNDVRVLRGRPRSKPREDFPLDASGSHYYQARRHGRIAAQIELRDGKVPVLPGCRRF